MFTWNFSVVTEAWPVFLAGLRSTCSLSLVACFFGTLLGIGLAFVRRARVVIPRVLVALYIEIFLALPLLALIIWIYYALPMLTSQRALFSAYWSACLALTLSTAPFVAEIFRSGVESISDGQRQSGFVLGMTRWQVTRYIIMPQALRRILPPLLGNYIAVIKLSSLASVIAVPELLYSAQNLSVNRNRPLEIYTALALSYCIFIMPLSLGVRALERRWKLRV